MRRNSYAREGMIRLTAAILVEHFGCGTKPIVCRVTADEVQMVLGRPAPSSSSLKRVPDKMRISRERGHYSSFQVLVVVVGDSGVTGTVLDLHQAVANVLAEKVEDGSSVEELGGKETLVDVVHLICKLVNLCHEPVPDLRAWEKNELEQLVFEVVPGLKAMCCPKKELPWVMSARR